MKRISKDAKFTLTVSVVLIIGLGIFLAFRLGLNFTTQTSTEVKESDTSRKLRATIYVLDAYDDPKLDIKMIFVTDEVLNSFSNYETTIKGEKVTIDMGKYTKKVIENNWPGQEVLALAISAHKTTYFWPINFVFTQGTRQYNLEYGDYRTIGENHPSEGGEIKEGIKTVALIGIPKEIELDKPFKLWYGDFSAKIGPLK